MFGLRSEHGGKILIPYGKTEKSDKCILIHNSFAQLADFTRLTEEYIFKCNYIVHPEALMMGNDAWILVRPSLTVNENVCDLKILWNSRIEVSTVSYIDDIPVKKTFENVDMTKGEIELNF